jgi:rhodanese-related sulfurtransferase
VVTAPDRRLREGPHRRLEERADEPVRPENKQLAPAKALPVVLVCKVGRPRAGRQRLRKAGFTNVNVLEGGSRPGRPPTCLLVKGRG